MNASFRKTIRFPFSRLVFVIVVVAVALLLPGTGWAAEKVAAGSAVKTENSIFVATPAVLPLQDCLDIALRENRILNQSKARVKSAKAKKDQVKATQMPVATALLQNSKLSKPSPSAADTQDTRRISITLP